MISMEKMGICDTNTRRPGLHKGVVTPPRRAAPSCWLASSRSRTGIPRWDLRAVSSQPYIHTYRHTYIQAEPPVQPYIQPYICLDGKDPA